MTDQLPIELECFLLKYGFFEPKRAPGFKAHAPVYIKEKKEDPRAARGWKPSYDGEDPPF